jgi:hypothetical protein
LVTAAHCYPDGAAVYTGWQNNGRNLIGTVAYRSDDYDAIAIDTAATGSTLGEEWDGACNPNGTCNVYSVTSVGFNYDGDLVCQDGYTSGIVCGLLITAENTSWRGDNGIIHYGVEAQQVNGQPGGRSGDSGGLVFALVGNNVRQARGIVSGGQFNEPTLFFTEVAYIFDAFGFQLAPQ